MLHTGQMRVHPCAMFVRLLVAPCPCEARSAAFLSADNVGQRLTQGTLGFLFPSRSGMCLAGAALRGAVSLSPVCLARVAFASLFNEQQGRCSRRRLFSFFSWQARWSKQAVGPLSMSDELLTVG